MFTCLISKKTQAQSSLDTTAYLQSIVLNKANYIGQPFSVLLDSLQIEIKYFFPYTSLPYDKSKETTTAFSFYSLTDINDLYLTFPRLRITWQPYLNANESIIIRATYNNKGHWNAASNTFYSAGIIADIHLWE